MESFSPSSILERARRRIHILFYLARSRSAVSFPVFAPRSSPVGRIKSALLSTIDVLAFHGAALILVFLRAGRPLTCRAALPLICANVAPAEAGPASVTSVGVTVSGCSALANAALASRSAPHSSPSANQIAPSTRWCDVSGHVTKVFKCLERLLSAAAASPW